MKAAALALLVAGCASLSPGQDVVIGCKTADVATTMYALRHGAVEANPLMHAVLAHGILPFLLIEGVVTWFLVRHYNEAPAIITVASCAPPAWNLLQFAR